MSELNILPQPDAESCGPACLHAVFRYFHQYTTLEEVIQGVGPKATGPVPMVHLAQDAIDRGFSATLHTCHFNIFDPGWKGLSKKGLLNKLRGMMENLSDKKLMNALYAYIHFLHSGGSLLFDPIDQNLFNKYLCCGFPVLCRINAARHYDHQQDGPLDIHPHMAGRDTTGQASKFVVLYSMHGDVVDVADPYPQNPLGDGHHYPVDAFHLLSSIEADKGTYDASLLVLSPPIL